MGPEVCSRNGGHACVPGQAMVSVRLARSVPGSLKDALPEDADGARQDVQEGQGAREGEEGLVGRRGAGQDQRFRNP